MSFLQITDIIIVALAAIFGIMGLVKGLTKQLFSIIALAGGIALIIFFGNAIIGLITDPSELDMSTKCIYYVVIFVVFYIAVRIIGHIITKGADKTPLGIVNRLLGVVWGVAKVALSVCVIMLAYEALMKIELVNNLLSRWIDLEEKGWGITVWLYNNNLITMIMGLIWKK